MFSRIRSFFLEPGLQLSKMSHAFIILHYINTTIKPKKGVYYTLIGMLQMDDVRRNLLQELTNERAPTIFTARLRLMSIYFAACTPLFDI